MTRADFHDLRRSALAIREPDLLTGAGIFLAGLSGTLIGTGFCFFIISALGGVGGY